MATDAYSLREKRAALEPRETLSWASSMLIGLIKANDLVDDVLDTPPRFVLINDRSLSGLPRPMQRVGAQCAAPGQFP